MNAETGAPDGSAARPPLTLYPTVDLLGGHCVRPREGDSPVELAFDGDPVAVAQRWQAAGATWLHVVDLDGALKGTPKHLEVVRAIVDATGLSVQAGGGLRSEADVAAAFEAGATRVILGTAALRSPGVIATCLVRWGERIAVSVDARGGKVTVAGWLESVAETAAEFAWRMAELGVKTLVVTNAALDGTLAGPDVAMLAGMRAELPATGLIAGGTVTLADLRTLASAGLDGAVLGRALYDGTLDLAEALRVAAGGDNPATS
jgi:phosphoribosylformimino-5-aminoimidazole carboxamide ribotide isomerase